ncbi:hypothetical protein Pint_02094 [Pistacia integerrima]|uniref:Uncharacterized protein n=1 Tax=Pistacia integerrima TaxID=434235 RepID=A0ACC0ZL85_9ROSI|nr:hypothetical protein Pint_02094 [Pistacia integerrima]
MIDSMQRLGVAYHFEEEIEEAINLLRQDVAGDLALQFRLLREHGHPIRIETKKGDSVTTDNSVEDTEGLLSLYEASFLGYQEEDVLEEAKDFSTKCLNNSLGKLEKTVLAEQVQQSLEIPLHWRMPRVEARNFINFYSIYDQNISVLLELAKLDYNLVQSIYQQELKELSRSVVERFGFKEKLSFSRDRLIENYLWTMGIIFETQFSKCRIGFTKFVCIFSAIDDMFDIYASLDGLELFIDAVKRWDIKAVEDFPYYMQICYFAMFNFVNDLAYHILQHHGLNTLSYIKKEENAWTSIGGPPAIGHAHLLQLQGGDLKKSTLNCLKGGYELIYWSSLITRLSNDLGTSPAEIKRGDVAKSIQCYMIEKGIPEEEARERIKGLIGYSWKMLNENRNAKSNVPKSMAKMCLNMARTSQCIFQHGDGQMGWGHQLG